MEISALSPAHIYERMRETDKHALGTCSKVKTISLLFSVCSHAESGETDERDAAAAAGRASIIGSL